MERMIMVGVMLLGAVLARPTVGVGQVADTLTAEKVVGTARQQQWLAATPQERVRLAEALGDEGARAMAKAKGYVSVYDGLGRMLPQGPDQVYRAADGRVILYEAKGGAGRLGHAYGHSQGSPEWAVESAKRVLRSGKATAAEQSAARAVLEAAAKGKLEVHVVRTSHVLGEPTAAVVERIATTTDDAARLARTALDDVVRASANNVDNAARAASASDDAARLARSAKFTRTATRSLIFVGVAVDAGFRVDDAAEVERRFDAGEISEQQREVEHAKNAAGMAGGWGGAVGGAKGGAVLGGMVGGPWGAAAGGVIGGVGGYYGGEAAAQAAAEWGMDRLHDTGASVKGAWDWAWGN